MLKIFDKNHNAIGHLVKYKDCRIESEITTGDKTLSFLYLAKHHTLSNEMYVRTRQDEYIIKEISENSDGFPEIVAALNLEDLEGKAWGTFSVKDVTIEEAARLALAGTGWTVGSCNVTKRRNAGMVHVNSLGVIQNLCMAYMCEPVFDTIKKTVSFYEERGEDKGVYFIRGLNLKKLQKKSTSYDFYTRIVPIGAENLTIESVNDGKNYLENHQYSEKIRTYIWKDDSYTDPQALKEDAEKKLNDLSKPEVSYSAEVRDLARQRTEYSILSYSLGDRVTLIDSSTGIREKQRIMKLVEYEADPNKNTCEIANTFLTFEELQEKIRAAADIVNYAMTSDGKIYVSDILNFESGITGSVTVRGLQGSMNDIQDAVASMNGDLAQVKVAIGELDTNFLRADEADLKYATIENLNVTNETVHSIQGDYASFKTITTEEFSAHKAVIDTLSGDFSSFKSGEFETLKSKQADFENITSTNFAAQTAEIKQISGDLADYKIVVTGDISAVNGSIDNLSGDLAAYKKVVAGEFVSAKGWMLEGSIGDAQISKVSAGKIGAGTIDTSIVTILGTDGRLQLSDNTIQIKDADRVRVQVGKDAFGDYTLAVWDASGNLIWDALGATENTIQRKIIRDRMVADDAAIKALKIDFQSFETALTDQGVTISGTVVQVGDKTLNVALMEQTQTITEYGETLTDHATKIAANESAIRLKVSTQDFDSYKNTVDGELTLTKSRLNTAESSITAMQGEIAFKVEQTELNAVKDKVSSLETWKAEASQKITKDGIIATVGDYYAYQTDLDGAVERLSTVETKAVQTADKFNWLVRSGTSATDFTLTDRTAILVADAINLKGLVTFSGLDSTAQSKINTAQDTANTANNRATYHYGTCVTAAATAAKAVTLGGFTLYAGAMVSVKFTYANTADSPTLNVNSTGAKAIYVYGAAPTASSPYNWVAGATVQFVYNGSQWVMTDTSAMKAMAGWCYNNDITSINGNKIYAGTVAAIQIASEAVTADKIATDAIKSKNYLYSSGNFSTAGTFLDLSNGAIRSKNFAITNQGDAYFKGTINAEDGNIADWEINKTYLKGTSTSWKETPYQHKRHYVYISPELFTNESNGGGNEIIKDFTMPDSEDNDDLFGEEPIESVGGYFALPVISIFTKNHTFTTIPEDESVDNLTSINKHFILYGNGSLLCQDGKVCITDSGKFIAKDAEINGSIIADSLSINKMISLYYDTYTSDETGSKPIIATSSWGKYDRSLVFGSLLESKEVETTVSGVFKTVWSTKCGLECTVNNAGIDSTLTTLGLYGDKIYIEGSAYENGTLLSDKYAAKSHSHAWGAITGKPTTFAPSTHSHEWDAITGKPSFSYLPLSGGSVTGAIKFSNNKGVADAAGHYMLRLYNSSTGGWATALGNTSYPTRIYTKDKVWSGGSTTTYFATTSSSDRRLKKDFGLLEEKIAQFFMDTEVFSFRYKLDDRKYHYGFIAQDVMENAQKYGIKDSDLFGSYKSTEAEYAITGAGETHYINYLGWVPLNTWMIQQAFFRIAEQDKMIKKLQESM